jgi:hypothetical protein
MPSAERLLRGTPGNSNLRRLPKLLVARCEGYEQPVTQSLPVLKVKMPGEVHLPTRDSRGTTTQHSVKF